MGWDGKVEEAHQEEHAAAGQQQQEKGAQHHWQNDFEVPASIMAAAGAGGCSGGCRERDGAGGSWRGSCQRRALRSCRPVVSLCAKQILSDSLQ